MHANLICGSPAAKTTTTPPRKSFIAIADPPSRAAERYNTYYRANESQAMEDLRKTARHAYKFDQCLLPRRQNKKYGSNYVSKKMAQSNTMFSLLNDTRAL